LKETDEGRQTEMEPGAESGPFLRAIEPMRERSIRNDFSASSKLGVFQRTPPSTPAPELAAEGFGKVLRHEQSAGPDRQIEITALIAARLVDFVSRAEGGYLSP
jgi:hypothetical protein